MYLYFFCDTTTTARNECVAWRNPCDRKGTMQCVDGSGDYTCICRTVGFSSYFGKNCSMSKCHICLTTYITCTHTHCTYMHTYDTYIHTYAHTHTCTCTHTHCTYMHTYGTYIHTYIRTYTHVPALTHTHTTHTHAHTTHRGRRGGEIAATDVMTSPVANCTRALYVVVTT